MAVRAAVRDDAGAIARVHVDSWRATYPGMLPDDYLASLDVPRFTARWERILDDPRERSVVLVAEEDGEVVGFASCGAERDRDPRYEGELYAIYLLPTAQGHGLGRALLLAAAQVLWRRGHRSMVVWVLRDNARARGFYERLGGEYLGQRQIDLEPGVSAMEVSYLWRDIQPLARLAATQTRQTAEAPKKA